MEKNSGEGHLSGENQDNNAPGKTRPRVELSISSDHMSAVIQLRGKPVPDVDMDSLIGIINAHRITYGLKRAELQKLFDEYTTSTESVELRAEIARGKPVVPGEDGRIEILVESKPVVVIAEDGRADYRNVERFSTVEKGQLIARIYPPRSGESGINVFGEEVHPDPVEPVNIYIGENVASVPGTVDYVSRIRGVFVYNKRTLDVSAVLEIMGDVGLESGNVRYDGSVNIQGAVARGSKLRAEGDVTVGGAVESGAIHTGGSLTVRKGINTRGEGRIVVGGNLKAVYVDNSSMIVNHGVTVEKSVNSSKIICHGELYLTDRGSSIISGEIICFGSITADSIGNRMETHTKLTLGEHYQNLGMYQTYLKEIEKLMKDYEKIEDKVVLAKSIVKRRGSSIPVDKQAEIRIIFKKYKEIQEKLKSAKTKAEYYKRNRYNPHEVQLVVRDTLYPGVEIHYRTYSEKITAPMTRAIISFLPGMEKPEISAYKPKKK